MKGLHVCCWIYLVELQKRGLPHAHTLIWLYNKTDLSEFEYVKIYETNVNKDVHEILTKNFILGSCGTLNSVSPFNKRYSQALVSNTVIENDGYLLRRRKSAKDGGKLVIIQMQNIDIKVTTGGLFYIRLRYQNIQSAHNGIL